MVAHDKNGDNSKNGPRSRGSTPNNGHLSDDSSSDDSDHESGMRVGDEYQVKVPTFNPDLKPETRAEAMLVWAPHPDLPGRKVDEYVNIAKEKHGYNVEQALGMLFWHKHNVDKSLQDLANFTPFPDEWTVEDKVLFEQAFGFHGKSFHRIRQMLPDKSIAQLVKYYYSWKKTRSRTSLMDRQAKKLTNHRVDSDDDMDESSDSESDMDTKESKEDKITNSRSGPTLLKKTDHPRNKHKKKPPRGMFMSHPDLLALATGPIGQGDALLKQLDMELVQLKRQVQNNKQLVSMYKQKTSAGISHLNLPETNPRINARWTNEELLLAVQGVRKYGKDFKAIAEVIGNKTEAHVRSFFVNYQRRYNLNEVLAEYEKENGPVTIKDDSDEGEKDMETEEKGNKDAASGDRVVTNGADVTIIDKPEPSPSASNGKAATIPQPPTLRPAPQVEISASQ